MVKLGEGGPYFASWSGCWASLWNSFSRKWMICLLSCGFITRDWKSWVNRNTIQKGEWGTRFSQGWMPSACVGVTLTLPFLWPCLCALALASDPGSRHDAAHLHEQLPAVQWDQRAGCPALCPLYRDSRSKCPVHQVPADDCQGWREIHQEVPRHGHGRGDSYVFLNTFIWCSAGTYKLFNFICMTWHPVQGPLKKGKQCVYVYVQVCVILCVWA